MKKDKAIVILENTIKQQLMCHKISVVSDKYPNHLASCTEDVLFTIFDVDMDDSDPDYEKLYDIFEECTYDEKLTINERAEKMYAMLFNNLPDPTNTKVFELNGTLRMVG